MNKIKILAVIAIIAMTGFLWMACDSSTDPDDGGGGGGGGPTNVTGVGGGRNPTTGTTPARPTVKYVVTVIQGDSTTVPSPASIEVASGGKVAANAITGYDETIEDGGGNTLYFAGWKIRAGAAPADGDAVFSLGTTPVTANIVIYPTYGPGITIMFNVNGGVAGGMTPTEVIIGKGGSISADNQPTPNPTKSGEIFKGWYTAATGGTLIVFGTTTFPEGGIVYAQYGPAITISFAAFAASDSLSTPPSDITIAEGTSIAEEDWPADPTPVAGRVFTGWFIDGEEEAVDFETHIFDDDTELVAGFVDGYTVTFDFNGWDVGDIEVAIREDDEDKTLTDPFDDDVVAPAGYTFGGWFTMADWDNVLAEEWNFADDVDDTFTLYAKLTTTVTYDIKGADGASNDPIEDSTVYQIGSDVTIDATASTYTKTNLTMKTDTAKFWWITKTTIEEVDDGYGNIEEVEVVEQEAVSGTITLDETMGELEFYLRWIVTISFAAGDTLTAEPDTITADPLEVDEGTVFATLAAAVLAGFPDESDDEDISVTRWFYEADGTTPVDFPLTIDADMTGNTNGEVTLYGEADA